MWHWSNFRPILNKKSVKTIRKPPNLLEKEDIVPVKLEISKFNGDFSLFKTSFKKIQQLPGLYLLKFSNGKMYVGETNNIFERLNQHYRQFRDGDNYDWHDKIHDYIMDKCYESGASFRYEFFKNTQLMVQYTNTKEEARLLEKKALKEICINEFKDRYYNIKFF